MRRRYELLVTTIDAIVWEADAETFRFLFVSPQAERILGYPPAAWLESATFWADHIHPDDRADAMRFCVEATRARRAHDFQYRMVAADGRIVWIHDTVSVIVEDGRPARLRGTMLDITERKLDRERLEASERELRATFDLSAYGQAHSDPTTGRWVRLNRKICEILGYSESELRVLTFGQLTHPDDLARQMPEMRRLFAGEVKELQLEKRMVRKDGAEIWVELGITLLRDGEGRPLRVIAIGADITDRKRAQKMIEESQRELEATFQLSSYPQAHAEPATGRLVRVNRKLCAVLGYSESELLAMNFGALTHPADREHEWTEIRRLIAGEVADVHLEKRMLRKDGTEIWVELAATLLRDAAGKPLRLIAIGADITERKRLDAALRASEAKLRDFAETASDWFWETDADHRFTYLSLPPPPAANGGRDPRLGQVPWNIKEDSPGTSPAWDEHMRQVAERKPFRDFVYRIRVGRDVRHVSVSGRPHFDAAGRFLGYRGTARDVTSEMEARQALVQAKLQAEAASKAKSEFLANMSHELRTPLNAIIGFAEFIEQETLGPLGQPRYREYLHDMGSSGRHLLDIINDILDVARIEAGKIALKDEALGLAATADGVVKIMAEQCARAGLTLVRDYDPALPRVRADDRALRQILLNLLSNAVKFTDPGGTITLALKSVAGSGVTLTVSDTGIGIAAEDVKRLMQPFAQVHSVYHRKHHGAGLGLTLVRSLAELHDGSVTIESEPGRGTTVTVSLPQSRVV